jgi:hypothetical protein
MSATYGRILLAAAFYSATLSSAACATHRARANGDLGIPACQDEAEKDLLSSLALQCWFMASHGQWRTLNHQSHLEALVVEVEARDLRDAVEIARRVTADAKAHAFTEILVYVARTQGRESHIRRVRWTQTTGFETLDFESPAGDTPLTIRASPGRTQAEPHPKP